jgi:hypothetical protein
MMIQRSFVKMAMFSEYGHVLTNTAVWGTGGRADDACQQPAEGHTPRDALLSRRRFQNSIILGSGITPELHDRDDPGGIDVNRGFLPPTPLGSIPDLLAVLVAQIVDPDELALRRVLRHLLQAQG